jgi:hypothetical protein
MLRDAGPPVHTLARRSARTAQNTPHTMANAKAVLTSANE